MNCNACGHANPERMKFCGECGASLAARCASCNAALPPGVKFCGECGARVAAAAAPAPPPERLYQMMGATGHAERLARELG